MIGVAIFCVVVFVGVCNAQHCGSTSTCSSQHGSHVCGTNGVTYTNYCYLNHAICLYKLQHRHLAMAYMGYCHRTTPATHIDTKHCDVICDEEEPASRVCLSDGQTYETQCDANNAICNATHNHHHLTVVSKGPCLDLHSSCADALHSHTCPHTQDYVCATNGYTYVNECYLRTAQCRLLSSPDNTKTIEVLHAGKCQDNSTHLSRDVDCSSYADMNYEQIPVAVEGGQTQVVKINHCNTTVGHQNLVCADGITYSDECHFCHRMALLHKISYKDGLTIPIAYDGRCHHQIIIG